MSKIRIELFGNEAELISFKQDGGDSLVMEFGEEYDGYLSIGKLTARIKGATCALDTRRLADGEYTPRLILTDMTVDLPRIKKYCGIITPPDPELPYVHKLSLRERRLSSRVAELEKKVEEITEKVWGSSLFKSTP